MKSTLEIGRKVHLLADLWTDKKISCMAVLVSGIELQTNGKHLKKNYLVSLHDGSKVSHTAEWCAERFKESLQLLELNVGDVASVTSDAGLFCALILFLLKNTFFLKEQT